MSRHRNNVLIKKRFLSKTYINLLFRDFVSRSESQTLDVMLADIFRLSNFGGRYNDERNNVMCISVSLKLSYLQWMLNFLKV